MLAHRRLAELQLLARRLRHVQGERAAVLRARGATLATAAATAAAAANKQHADVVVLRRQPHTVRAAHADEQLQRLDVVLERLLFRRLPVALSLVERSVAAHMPANTTSRTTAAAAAVAAPQHEQLPAHDDSGATVVVHDTCSEATRPAAQLAHVRSDALLQQQQRQQQRVQLRIARVLLLALHDAEYARRRLYDEKLRQLQRRCALAQRAVRRPRRGSGDDDNDDAAAMHDAKAALRAAREDVQLLQQSLLARPYLSARMWRMLLCDGVWAAAVARQQQQQQQREGNVTASSSSPALLLLHMCLTFARLTLGVLREYVHGGTVNATSPRFAASLPSAAWRTRTATRIGDSDVTNDDEHTKNKNNNNENDNDVVNIIDDKSNNDAAGQSAAEALFSVMQHDDTTARDTATTPPTRGGRRRTRRARPQLSRLRWLPPRSATVVPLMLDTLAMHSFVVPELCVEALVRAGYVADVLALFVTLQKAAMVLLALHNDGDSTSADAATRTRLHTVLQRLERALLQHGARTRDALAQELLQQTQPQPSTRTAVQLLLGGSHHSSSSNGSGSVHAHTVTAAATAARVLIDLDHLQLLQLPPHTRTRTRAHTRTRDTAAALVDALQLVLFPQLRTNTYATLAARARHTALLAYTTRRHRAHLYKQHGGPAGATRYLLQTVVQHARLQRRQMAAALHDRYLHNAQHDAAVALARALSLDDAVRLLHLFITHACDTPSDGGAVAASRGTAARQLQQQLHTTDHRVTVVLLMADVMLLVASMSHTPSRRADDNVQQQQQQHELLPLALLANLWVSLTRLWPVIDSRRELQRHGRHSQHSSAAAHVAVVHNETALLTAMCEYVLHAINGQLAMRLQWLQRQHDKEATGDSSSSHSSDDVDDVAVTAADVVVLATGLREWGGSDGDSVAALQLLTTPQRARRPAALLTLAQTTGKLLRELMLHDVALWSAVRTHSLAERQRFEQHLRSTLHSMGALDTAADTALQRICYAV